MSEPLAVEALRGLLSAYDPERAVIDVEPDPGCLECTAGTTPHDRQTGPCAYHKALRAIAKPTQLLDALGALVCRDVEYHGSEIRIPTKTHGEAIRLVADARAAIAAATGSAAND